MSWKLGCASWTLRLGEALTCEMNCSGIWWVTSNWEPSMAATRLESSGTILIESFSNFTGPLFWYIEGPPLYGWWRLRPISVRGCHDSKHHGPVPSAVLTP